MLLNQAHTIFHTSNWAEVLYESYHYKPIYFSEVDKDKNLLAIPFMEIKSPITVKKGVSLPFSGYCAPIIPRDIRFKDVFDHIVEYGQKHAGWKFIGLFRKVCGKKLSAP